MLKKIIKLSAHVHMHLSVLASIAILCCSLVDTTFALPFNKISQVYFFGDSLTDSGFNNLFPISPGLPAGKAPTFTTYNGYIWSQYVAHDIKGFVLPANYSPFPNPPDTITNNTTPLIPGTWPVLPDLTGVDYACGGSTTNSTGNGLVWAPSLHSQISWFLANSNGHLDPNAVYFIWSGANDILTLLPSSPTQLQLLMAANTAANNIASEVARLSAYGAKRVVVLSLPNIGYTPLVNELAQVTQQPTLPASMKTLTYSFNSMLNQQLGRVIASAGIKLLYIDVYDVLDNVILATKAGKPYVVAGQSFLFTNYTDPACGLGVSAIACPPGTPSGYIFADDLHPTDMAHRLLSLVVETAILTWA